jgi:hypothetical protein
VIFSIHEGILDSPNGKKSQKEKKTKTMQHSNVIVLKDFQYIQDNITD